MVRTVAIASLIGSCVAVKDFSFVQQVVGVETSEDSGDYMEETDYVEDYEEDARQGKRGKGKGETDAPTAVPTDAPTPAPTEAPTVSRTPDANCWAYSDMYAIDHRYNGEVVAGQIPYTGMIACQSTVHASKMYAARPLTNQVSNRWAGTCSHTAGGWPDNSWWVVLPEVWTVDSIQITNRGDCCGGRLLNADILVGDEFCANTKSIGQGQTVRYQCERALRSDVIKIQAASGQALTICGFQAYGSK